MDKPIVGIVIDAAHSEKYQKTEYQGKVIESGERIFYNYLGYQTVNIGEFLALVKGIKWIIENDYAPRIIYSDSNTAISWFNSKKTASNKKNNNVKKAELFLQLFSEEISTIEVRKWDNVRWGENPADFGNK